MRVTCAFSALLFLLFIKNVPLHTSVKIRLSTDACVLYHTVKPPLDHAIFNNSFSHLGSWSKSWQMSINFSKTVIMSFTRHFYYGFNNVSLRRVIRIEVPYRYRYDIIYHGRNMLTSHATKPLRVWVIYIILLLMKPNCLPTKLLFAPFLNVVVWFGTPIRNATLRN